MQIYCKSDGKHARNQLTICVCCVCVMYLVGGCHCVMYVISVVARWANWISRLKRLGPQPANGWGATQRRFQASYDPAN